MHINGVLVRNKEERRGALSSALYDIKQRDVSWQVDAGQEMNLALHCPMRIEQVLTTLMEILDELECDVSIVKI